MAEFFFDYGLFFLKTLTGVILVGALLAFVVSLVARPGHAPKFHLEIVKLNSRLKEAKEALLEASLDDVAAAWANKERRAQQKAERKAEKKALKSRSRAAQTEAEAPGGKPRVFVLDFDGDLRASAVEALREEITALLSVAESSDEVVVRLDSGGGMVHAYGLAASQLARITARDVPLTVCVDKVAASGGYLMACVANTVLAAPFAVIGSIGVVAQLPNFHRLLKKHDVDFEMLTAGKHKRTLTVLGNNTPEGRRKFQADLEETHNLFQAYVGDKRPQVDLERVATGEVWYGTQALALGLVDRLGTSDDYLASLADKAEILQLHYKERKTLQQRLAATVDHASSRVVDRAWQAVTGNALFR